MQNHENHQTVQDSQGAYKKTKELYWVKAHLEIQPEKYLYGQIV